MRAYIRYIYIHKGLFTNYKDSYSWICLFVWCQKWTKHLLPNRVCFSWWRIIPWDGKIRKKSPTKTKPSFFLDNSWHIIWDTVGGRTTSDVKSLANNRPWGSVSHRSQKYDPECADGEGVSFQGKQWVMGCQEDFRHSKTVNPYSYLVGPFENIETY